MEINRSEQYLKVAQLQGAYIGCMWLASFICMANTLAMPLLSVLGMGIGIGSLMAIVVMTYQFRWRICKGDLSLLRAWSIIIQAIFYASILMAFGVFLYMKFMDHGAFGAYYEQMLSDPSTRLMMDQILAGTGVTSEEFVSQFTSITPINLAINILESNVLMGFFVSLPLALLSRIKVNSKLEKMN